MKFTCAFGNIDSRETRDVDVTLTEDECAKVRAIREGGGVAQADLIAQVYALRQVYRELLSPDDGWRHASPPRELRLS